LYEDIDEIVVVVATNSMPPPAYVDRALQSILVVRSDIEKKRKTIFGMNATQGCVKSHLSDRDTHATRALIAESQNSFPVADYDAFHIVVARMVQDLSDAVLIWIAEEQTPRLSPNLAEALAALAHGGRINQRQHLFDIAN
jgi:hypothetical protein